MTSIYSKYGGHEFFHDCIYALYLDLFDNPEISHHFLGVDIRRLSKLQTEFLIRAIGGPDIYSGRSIPDIHGQMGITPYQFKKVSKSFYEVFVKRGVSPRDARKIMKFVKGFEKEIVTTKRSFWDYLMRPFYRFLK